MTMVAAATNTSVHDKLQLLSSLYAETPKYDLPPLYDEQSAQRVRNNADAAAAPLDAGDQSLNDTDVLCDFAVPQRQSSTRSNKRGTQHDSRPKRKYNTAKAAQTRMIRNEMRKRGIDPGPHYKPRGAVKRKWVASGKYRGANLKKGGNLRNFKDAAKYSQMDDQMGDDLDCQTTTTTQTKWSK